MVPPLRAIEATSTSPAVVPDGTLTVRVEEAVVFAVVAAPRKFMPGPGIAVGDGDGVGVGVPTGQATPTAMSALLVIKGGKLAPEASTWPF
jgi:hypothetical protein